VDLWLAESFVDRQRFSGASYRAANWQALGWTRGFAKQQGRFVQHGQSKEVYVYVMEARMRQFIHGDAGAQKVEITENVAVVLNSQFEKWERETS
jgi:hypothetical protein